jgi:cysteine desulfurase
LLSGGGQERGLRSGTVPTPLVVGLGKACEIAKAEMGKDEAHVKRLSERLLNGIFGHIQHVTRNGEPSSSYPGT